MVIYVHDGQKDLLGIFTGQDESENEDILITPRIVKVFLRNHGLYKELRPKHLFVFGIGTVATGFFTQWNLGLRMAGPFGMLFAIIFALFIYLTFFKVLARFSANFPYAGGPYAYARQGLGTFGGYLAGIFTTLQFICASALVLIIARNFFSLIYPELPGNSLVMVMFISLIALHVSGILVSAIVQIFLAGSALSGIILFFIGSAHAVNINILSSAPVVSNGWQGIAAALPTAMWFYLGLESITMSAEETRKPQRDVPLSLMVGLGFASVISLAIWFFGVGAVPWRLLIKNDFPLLFILSEVQSQDKVLLTVFPVICLSVFSASLHGFINGYSRQVYALSRAGYFPHFFSRIRPKQLTPSMAIFIPGLASIVVSYTWSIQTITVLTLFWALFVYLLVIISFLRISRSEPEMFYGGNFLCHPFILGFNICLLITGQIALIYYNLPVFWIISAICFIAVLYYHLFARKHISNEAPEESAAVSTQNKVRIEFK